MVALEGLEVGTVVFGMVGDVPDTVALGTGIASALGVGAGPTTLTRGAAVALAASVAKASASGFDVLFIAKNPPTPPTRAATAIPTATSGVFERLG